MKKIVSYFSKGELILLSASILLIVGSFLIFDRGNYLTLAASLIGAVSLILCAKGNPLGQLLMIVFSVLYGVISFGFHYYGEMATYLGMTAPMAVVSLISWLKNPYEGRKSEVRVDRLGRGEKLLLIPLTAAVTVIFYFILKAFKTANLAVSTFSVATSFFAVYLTFRRSAYFAAAYALNDFVLIILWALASLSDSSYLSVMICFIMFLANDIYGFINWRRMRRRQEEK
ncbi:MAG: nicotinamide riboside transporter PnuC [Bacteroides sp.]|nr:nicotinamide riboside transporter PnuC [Eubacterium sp.]MCM1417173.1 nicotinamide riboside transporter PnuC [Roseburia sp.]MCM1461206.1 nicotinamide riboside transporter PnuC [Bacteroides sp.]